MVAESVLSKVVANGICVGCGICAGTLPSELKMVTNDLGAYVPQSVKGTGGGRHGNWEAVSLELCPFADTGHDEDSIALELFGGSKNVKHRTETGYYLLCFAGHVTDSQARLSSASGGLITWISRRLLERQLVDAIACVGPARERGPDGLFEYRLVDKRSELSECRKSRYYPVHAAKILNEIRQYQGTVAFVGLPCFIKGIHLASLKEDVIAENIRYTIGLVCGHLKTKKYTSYLARHCDVSEGEISTVDFRRKIPSQPANRYAFEVVTTSGGVREVKMADVWASSWGNNLFMLGACEVCDDVFAETADIVVGDAWLPRYIDDYRGNSLVICRDEALLDEIEAGIERAELGLDPITIQEVIASQAGGLRQRRDGLQYRLHLWHRRGVHRPRKRVEPDGNAGTLLFRLLQRVRMRLSRVSKTTFRKMEQRGKPGLHYFIRRTLPLLFAVRLVNAARRIKRVIGMGRTVLGKYIVRH